MSNAHRPRRPLPASYVVRLYRADPARLQAMAGVVEDLERGLVRSFRNGDELLRVLTIDEAAALPAAGDDQPSAT